MSGFQGYDQWKTASPYDDEPDPIEEAERFLSEHATIEELEALHKMLQEENDPDVTHAKTLLWARTVIEALLQEI